MNLIKHWFSLIALISILVTNTAFALNKADALLVQQFIDAIANNDKSAIARVIKYPFEVDPILRSIKNPEEFSQRFDEVFDQTLLEKISRSKPSLDWAHIGWRGIALDSGIIWLDENGKLIGTNYQTPQVKMLRNQIIDEQKKSLYGSLQAFQTPIIDWETKNYRIRVDQLDNSKYRLALWPRVAQTTDKPLLILDNGQIFYDGTGGNHHYDFTNKGNTYRLEVIVLGEEGVTNQFSKLNAKTELISEPVIVNHYSE